MKTKEDILEEIRRTARENGDKPLGITRFKDETGITDSEWQRYWPRFSAAQIEAGYKKNPFGNPSYSKEYIFEKFIILSRELGKIAVNGEWKVKRHNDPSFPSINSLERLSRHLGSRQKFLTELLKYSEEKGYADIVELCKNTSKKETIVSPKDDALKNETIGYVYLGKQHGNYKIGHAKDANRRREDITLLGSEPFILIHEMETDDMKGVEKYWHNRFKSKLLRGEWFKLDSNDVKAFKRWKRIF